MNVLRVALKQILACAYFLHFPDVNKSLNRFSLKIVILKRPPSPSLVVGHEPIAQQSTGRIGNARNPPAFQDFTASRIAGTQAPERSLAVMS